MPDDASSSRRSAVARRPSRTSMLGCAATSALSSRRIRRPVALPPACATRRRECPPSSPSARFPSRSASNVTPSRSRSRKRAGASSTRMRAAEARTIPRPAAIVSCEMQLGRVVGGERGREPALGPVRRGLGQRAGGDQRDPRALARGGQRGVEPGRAGAHDDEVGPVHGEEPVRYPRAPDRLAAPPALARPRGAAAPGAAGADHRARGGDGAPRLVRVRRRARAGGDARAAARRAPGRAHRLHRGRCPPPGAGRSTTTRSRCPRPTRRRCGRRGALSRWSMSC